MSRTKLRQIPFDGASRSNELTRRIRRTGIGVFSGKQLARPEPRKPKLAQPDSSDLIRRLLRRK